jgi:nitric oxide dioxygenase
MTPEDITLIQESWAGVVPISDTAATLFYGQLFETAPEVRPLFTGDMDEQGRKLMRMLGLVVNGLPRLAELVPDVGALGRRHAGYGVAAEHYPAVGAALIWTLQQGLGPAFTPAHEAAWSAAYGVLADTMLGAAAARAA